MGEPSGVPYPHIKGAGTLIPDCSRGVYRPFRLDPAEKRELIKEVAEKGLRGIDEFLSSEREGGAIAERLREIRQRLEEQAAKVRARRQETLEAEINRLMDQGGLAYVGSDDGLIDEHYRRHRLTSEDLRGEILASELISALEAGEQLPSQVLREGFFKRVVRSLKAFLIRLARAVYRFFKSVAAFFSSDKRAPPSAGTRKGRGGGVVGLPFPGIEKDLGAWERDLDRRLGRDAALQRAVDRGLSAELGHSIGRVKMGKVLDQEWYRREAGRFLREEVRRKAEKKAKELEEERSRSKEREKRGSEERRRSREEIMRLEKAFEREKEELDRTYRERSRAEIKGEVISLLSSMGYLERAKDGSGEGYDSLDWEVTEALVEKFSEFLYAEISRAGKGHKDRRGRHVSDAGVYEKARLLTVSEEPRMDMLQTIINARTNHPSDRELLSSDMIVMREVTTSELHGIILMDISGSMEENKRLEAAKRAVLALSSAIRRENPRNRIDVIMVSTRAYMATLRDVISAEPKGFTNHQEALSLARSLFSSSKADRRVLFLITDGLPEAYLDAEGRPVAGDLPAALDRTLTEARVLARSFDMSFTIFLLEPKDDTYVRSARKIAKEGGGTLVIADPNELARKVLSSFEGEGEVLKGV